MKKYVASILALAMALMAVSCSKSDDKNEGNPEEDNNGTPNAPVLVIDGDFSDWAALGSSEGVAVAKNHPDSPYEGVKEIRCYATPEYVYYYIRYDGETLDEQMEKGDALHIRLCLNTDGEFASGYASYFLEAYDFIIEGSLASDGVWGEFDGTLSQRTYVEAKGKVDWLTLVSPGKGLVTGKGNGKEYEISLDRAIFNSGIAASTAPNQPIGDEFQTGIRFYCNGWSELSNMPNASAEEGNGWGHLLTITTVQ